MRQTICFMSMSCEVKRQAAVRWDPREDLDDRLRRHNAGESNATKHGVPWRLLHTESFAMRSEAAIKERYYKWDEVAVSSIGLRPVAAATALPS